jgi:uncharacterized protein
MQSMNKLTLILMKETLAVCRLSPQDEMPAWVLREPFFCATRTQDELSLLLPQDKVPAEWVAEKDWRAFKLLGPLPFNLIGILASIANPLAQAGISIFALSTYDTDYLLVRSYELQLTCEVLDFEGFIIQKD